MKKVLFLLFFFITKSVLSHVNPFLINFPEKENLTSEDYIEIQNQLRNIDVSPILNKLYPHSEKHFTPYKEFSDRLSVSACQTLIDPEDGLFPISKLVKIGVGGDRCLVCFSSLNKQYPSFIHSLIEGLKKKNFNGYVLYRIGGWPNPTGREIKYVGVPYSFKIFMMVEAYERGFTNVLWVDSACYPLRNIDPLFDEIKRNGALLRWLTLTREHACRYILPQTRDILEKITGTDVLASTYVTTGVFGLKMDTPEAKKLVKMYYELAELGTPFLSCFPEEWVINSILGRSEFRHLFVSSPIHPSKLLLNSLEKKDDSPEEFEKIRKQGIYFYLRKKL